MTSTMVTTESRTHPRWRRRFVVLAVIALTVAAVFFWASILRHPVAGEIHLGTAHGEDQFELYVGTRFGGTMMRGSRDPTSSAGRASGALELFCLPTSRTLIAL